jgi:hypothetical protein
MQLAHGLDLPGNETRLVSSIRQSRRRLLGLLKPYKITSTQSKGLVKSCIQVILFQLIIQPSLQQSRPAFMTDIYEPPRKTTKFAQTQRKPLSRQWQAWWQQCPERPHQGLAERRPSSIHRVCVKLE